MSKARLYNPLSLNIKTDEPTFVNEDGVKWWAISIGSHLNEDGNDIQDGVVYRVLRPDGFEAYLVIHNDAVVFETGNLEHAFAKVDEIYLRRTK